MRRSLEEQTVPPTLPRESLAVHHDTVVTYQSGFNNELATEALPGALPIGRNSPQRCSYGLYAEQLSGTAFTAPRGTNRRSWLYRIRPAAMHEPFARIDDGKISNDFNTALTPPNRLR